MKNPNRVAAGKRNRALRQPLSSESREKLREAIRRHKPWRLSTGPRTTDGKLRSAANSKLRVRRSREPEVSDLVRGASSLLSSMAKLRRSCHINVEEQSLCDGAEFADQIRDALFTTSQNQSRQLAKEVNQIASSPEEPEN